MILSPEASRIGGRGVGLKSRGLCHLPSAIRPAFLARAAASICGSLSAAAVPCSPGWSGTVLINCDSAANWALEHDTGSSGSLKLAAGLIGGQAIEIDYDLG